MRTDLITTLTDQLWNASAQAYRAAMREYGLTDEELTALDRQIMDRTLTGPKPNTHVTSRQVNLRGCDRPQCQIGFPIL